MKSRERVIAALDHKPVDRVPRDLWALPGISLFRKDELDEVLDRYPSDIGIAELSPGSNAAALEQYARPCIYTDEWGSVWQVGEPGITGEVKKPAVSDWSSLDTFKAPWDELRARDTEHINAMCGASDQFMLSCVCARPFERLQFVRGSENVFMDLAYETPELFKLLEIIHEFYLAEVEFWCKTDVDGVFLMDDWGTNTSMLISPNSWREHFKPIYKDYCDIIHKAGKRVFFHSDGHIAPIYPDLIEVGVDALNSQLFCMDIDELAANYKGKITFWGEIDRQHALPFGTPDDVKAAVRRVRSALDDGNGGVIAQCEWGIGNSKKNIEAVYDAWLEKI